MRARWDRADCRCRASPCASSIRSSLEDVPIGGEGELIVRGPNLMHGYHNKPAETAAALRKGWYHTGDLAKSDANGYLTITGRIKELIIRGGQNIAPAEIEEVAVLHPQVVDCAVVGIRARHAGRSAYLFVVAEGGELDVDSLMAHCRTGLSSYKIPEQTHVVTEIPRTGSGKIMRFRLVEASENWRLVDRMPFVNRQLLFPQIDVTLGRRSNAVPERRRPWDRRSADTAYRRQRLAA